MVGYTRLLFFLSQGVQSERRTELSQANLNRVETLYKCSTLSAVIWILKLFLHHERCALNAPIADAHTLSFALSLSLSLPSAINLTHFHAPISTWPQISFYFLCIRIAECRRESFPIDVRHFIHTVLMLNSFTIVCMLTNFLVTW